VLHKSLPLPYQNIAGIASRFETPVYIYDQSTIEQRCRDLTGAFEGLPVSWLYAMKANDNPHILALILKQGFGFDTVSPEEMLLGRAAGAPAESIFYTENNMTDAEMDMAIREGVMLNIGSFTRFEAFCRHPEATTCCIRIKPDLGDGHHQRVVTGDKESKFGIQTDLIPDLIALAAKSGKKITGLHIHIGSGIKKPENLLQAAEILIQHAAPFPHLEFLNFGGGLPTPYKPSEHRFDVKGFGKLFSALLQSDLKKRPSGFRYFFEPGRWLVAEAGMLVTTVTSIKRQGEKNYLGTDTGFNHLVRPAMYEAFHDIVNISASGEALVEYTISGNICESGDILGTKRLLPESQVGDVLVIADTGAYGMAMASEYNRRRLPPEILVDANGNETVIRPRKSLESALRDFLKETGFPH
jgi:diaminopimelate decarboxylase